MAMQPLYGWDGNIIMPPVQSQQNQQYPSSLSNMSGSSKQSVFYIPGRSVDNQDEVKPYEVLMDSPVNIFPNNNRQEIYVKYWGEKGIETDTYVLQTKETNPKNQNEPDIPAYLESIMDRLDGIEKKLNSRPYYKKGGSKNGKNNNTSGPSNDNQN